MIKISIADFNTILLHAEKISNGQIDFVEVLREELKNKLGIDNFDKLIYSLTQNEVLDVQNHTRLFLAQFNFIIEDELTNYHLVKLSDNHCELDIIPDTENLDSKEIISTQNVNPDNPSTLALTLEQRVVKIQFHLQNIAQSAIIIGQELIECKKEVGHGDWLNWLKENFNLKYTAATRFMQIAERFGNVPTSEHLTTSQMFEMLSLPEADTEKFIEEKSAAGTPVEDMTVKKLRAEIKDWKAQAEKNKNEAQKYKTVAEEKDAKIENQSAQINSLYNENVKLLAENNEAEAAKEKVTDLQNRIEQLYDELENKTIEVVPTDDYEANKAKIVELSTKIQQLENQLAQNTVFIDTATAKSLKSISKKIETQLSKGADVVPRSDFEKLKKELHQLKLQQDPIFASSTAAQFRTFYDLAETLSLKLLHPNSDLDYCLEYFEQDGIIDLIANLQAIAVDLERNAKKKWNSEA